MLEGPACDSAGPRAEAQPLTPTANPHEGPGEPPGKLPVGQLSEQPVFCPRPPDSWWGTEDSHFESARSHGEQSSAQTPGQLPVRDLAQECPV